MVSWLEEGIRLLFEYFPVNNEKGLPRLLTALDNTLVVTGLATALH